MTVVDIVQQQKEMKAHVIPFVLWPQQWEGYPGEHQLAWQLYKLTTSERGKIPTESGVYTLLVQPGVAEHPAVSYLMYVGKHQSLRKRFREYLTSERRETGRPKVFGGLKIYSDYVWFCFAKVPIESLHDVEDELLIAFARLPWNERYPARISKVVNAW